MGKKTIKVKSFYCEILDGPVAQQIAKRSFPVKTGYWISRAIDKIRQEAKPYMVERDKLIEKHRDDKKHAEAEKKDTLRPGQVILKDANAFNKEVAVLQEIEVDLGIEKIEVDLEVLEKWLADRGEKELKVGELEFLLPFFEIKQ